MTFSYAVRGNNGLTPWQLPLKLVWLKPDKDQRRYITMKEALLLSSNAINVYMEDSTGNVADFDYNDFMLNEETMWTHLFVNVEL